MAENAKELWAALSRQLGMSPGQIQASCEAGDAEGLLQNTDSDTARQVASVLNDPAKAKALLDSPQAQELLRLLGQQ